MTREEEIKARVGKHFARYLTSTTDTANLAEDDIFYLLARNEELHGDLEWHKRELEEKVDEIYWLADDKIDLRDENEELTDKYRAALDRIADLECDHGNCIRETQELQRRVSHLESALGAIKEEAAAFASDERDLGYIFIGIYTTATNALDAKEQDYD